MGIELITRAMRTLWALPLTVPGLGLLLLALGTGGRWHSQRGALVASGGLPGRWLCAGRLRRHAVMAITCGQVILGRDESSLRRALAHEMAHVRQFERWGIILPVAYLAGGVAAMLRGGHYYQDNPFEVEARAAEGAASLPTPGQRR